MEFKICPNCNTKLNGFMTSKYIAKEETTSFINSLRNEKAEAYCSECAVTYLNQYEEKVKTDRGRLQEIIKTNLKLMPIITAHSPLNWDYTISGIVSSQTVTGTGLLSEFTSSWSDFMGGQSGSLQNKLSDGEILCRNQLRYKAAMLGCNAVIAADVDYAEVGGGKGMLMVCMAGTAVRLKNSEEVLTIDFNGFEQLQQAVSDFNNLKKVVIPSEI